MCEPIQHKCPFCGQEREHVTAVPPGESDAGIYWCEKGHIYFMHWDGDTEFIAQLLPATEWPYARQVISYVQVEVHCTGNNRVTGG